MFTLSPRTLLLLLITALASWFGMMIVHESGHVLAAWLSGGRVERVVLDPLGFSRTDLAENPSPTFVAFAGTVWGSSLPLLAWLAARATGWRQAFLLRAFAGFCLLANGAYLASAAILPVGDSEDLLRLGVPRWLLVVPGIAAIAAGLAAWNGLGDAFGLRNRPINRNALLVVACTLLVLVLGMSLWTYGR